MSMLDRLYKLYTELRTPRTETGSAARLAKRLQATTVALVTTAGVRLIDQPPFNTAKGDPTFREIPGDAEVTSLIPDHTHYDISHARADIDTIFPLRTLRSLAAEGWIGAVSSVHVGLMGYIPDTEPLLEESIPQILKRIGESGAGAVVLSPG